MKAQEGHTVTLDTITFNRVRKWYLLALAAIAFSIILAQALIQDHLNGQLDDSRVINVAGRQRAYSQKLVKVCLLLSKNRSTAEPDRVLVNELDHTLFVWNTSHEALLYGNDSLGIPSEMDPVMKGLLDDLTPVQKEMSQAAAAFKNALVSSGPEDKTEGYLTILLDREGEFLVKMDAIVNAYDERSKEQLQRLKLKEYLLLAFSLLILLLELVFIFRPLAEQIRQTIGKLLISSEKSREDARQIEKIAAERERSIRELRDLNFAIDEASLFASVHANGQVATLSKKFMSLLGITTLPANAGFSEVLTRNPGQEQYIRELLLSGQKHIRSEELEITNYHGEQVWLDMSIIPMYQPESEQRILILCSDITQRMTDQKKIEQLNKERYEERMRQKQLQASLVVAGQEEERKRIAKDIHDGIGQMLTALKFNIESLKTGDREKLAQKVSYLKDLTADLIRGVRIATFNLTPPELGDHGIFPALQKMTSELSRLTGKNILFENKAETNLRFDPLAETNIYRVTQEAVNNAIKYARSNYILISVNLSDHMLSIRVEDDGSGFDTDILNELPRHSGEGGMGVFFMKERMSYINGRLFIRSAPGEGTCITINYQLEQKDDKDETQ